ncbi:hypothetical protein NPIL_453841 [Nephila pilipes]|uniref:Uncharacterized protein n=1 Tax=Nephila pilipes TaxID=299642 RepID=A0A8X6U703_NEPPI|nr:hypothetical protein NPIL_453841 [Nephila pilipes]
MWLHSHHRTASIFNRLLTSDKMWVLYDTPKRFKYRLSSKDTVPHCDRPSVPPRKIILCVLWTGRQVVYYKLRPTSLRTCTRSNWNVCNIHCKRRSQHL